MTARSIKQITVVLIVLVVAVAALAAWQQGSNDAGVAGTTPASTILATELTVPWKVVRLPDESLLVTERSGTLQRIGTDAKSFTIAGVRSIGEGGLLGLTLHPKFADNQLLYLYLTSEVNGSITNRVERYRLANDQLSDRTVIIDNIPGATNHDGGAVEFGPDGLLYISTGDANDEASAQNTSLLSGKILRLTDNGSLPADNPFDNAVYSYGHRNPQGLAWDAAGQLWATEHGRSGLRSGYDELNLIEAGNNYGWPVIEGDETRANMVRPVAHSGAGATWAPSGLAYADGSLYFGGLRGRSVYQATIGADARTVTVSQKVTDTYGRIRGVTADGDQLLITTSNQDGRGDPAADDDKIISIRI